MQPPHPADDAGVALIGHRLRTARTNAGLTRLRLAVAIGVDPSTIRRWEVGGAAPTAVHLARLARALDVTADELIEGAA